MLQLSDGADAAGHRDRVRNSRGIPAMGLIASMPMDDWPGRHAEVDIGWAAASGPTGCTGQPGAAATSTAPAGPRRRWDAYAETPS